MTHIIYKFLMFHNEYSSPVTMKVYCSQLQGGVWFPREQRHGVFCGIEHDSHIWYKNYANFWIIRLSIYS